MNIEAKLKDILLQVLDVTEADITPSASLTDDLNATSLDMVDILVAIETTFGVTIPDEQSEAITTVQDAINVVEAALAPTRS